MSASLSVISRKRLALSVAALAALQQLAMAGGAYAGTSANLSATASVSAECYISDATLNFGTVGAIGGLAAVTATASATGAEPWNCTNGTTATLAAASDNVTLAGAASSLTAGVSYASVGGAGASSSPSTVTGSGVSSNASIYGQLPIPTTTKAGSYAGTVGLTVTFS